MMFSALPTALQLLIAPLLLLWPRETPQGIFDARLSWTQTFTLRHEHAVTNDSQVLFTDLHPQQSSFLLSSNHSRRVLKSNWINIHRPKSFAAYDLARTEDMSDADLWIQSTVPAPRVDDRETLLTLAKMTNNAYYTPDEKGWYSLGSSWGNRSEPFGWEPDADGFRGYIFVSEDNSTVVLSVKGTSAGWAVGGGGPTVKKDKLNDNLLFSCCCARVGPTWSTVCDCFRGGYKCNQSCLQGALTDESLFYSTGINLYRNVTYLYPDADIWLTGHSLGGGLASLMGATFGAPTVAFEAPGEKLASQRLHLPSPPSTHHITHVYNTADSIAMGVCNGVTSFCAAGGYALETKCHLGQSIIYDTVAKYNWGVDIRKHSIAEVIDHVLNEDWDYPEKGVAVPKPIVEDDCVDCYNWEFGDFEK